MIRSSAEKVNARPGIGGDGTCGHLSAAAEASGPSLSFPGCLGVQSVAPPRPSSPASPPSPPPPTILNAVELKPVARSAEWGITIDFSPVGKACFNALEDDLAGEMVLFARWWTSGGEPVTLLAFPEGFCKRNMDMKLTLQTNSITNFKHVYMEILTSRTTINFKGVI